MPTHKDNVKTGTNIHLSRRFIAITDLLFIVIMASLILVLYLPATPYEFNLKSPIGGFIHQITLTETTLIVDIISATIIIILLSNVYLMLSYEDIFTWFEFCIGFILGLGLSIFWPPLSPFFFILGFILAILLFFFSSSVNFSLASGVGFILGYSYFIIAIYTAHTVNLPITSLTIMFFLGVLLGVIIVSGISFEFDFSILAIYIFSGFLPILMHVAYGDFVFGSLFLLGMILVLLLAYEPKIKIAIIVLAASLSLLYFTDGLVHEFLGAVLFIFLIALGQFVFATLYKKSVRSEFMHWLLSSMKSGTERIDLSTHAIIPSFGRQGIAKKSYSFACINYLIISYLKRLGFRVELVEEMNNAELTTYVKGIYVIPPKKQIS
ncbi:MAG: hypothetical protein DRO67_04245 [Candidatus Asgardarchaeum californiense]|nr:MAG: hypothetical protein DRO67_04245 [Candidatus Asgardarchaeum californiense]